MTDLLVLNAGKHELQAVSLDGTCVRTLVAGLDELPDGIVVDQRRGHVYWTNMGAPDAGSAIPGEAAYTRNGSLERADLDGGNRITIVPRGAFTCGKQLTADFEEGVLYWCDREGLQVLRCNLDGGAGRRRGGSARCTQPPCRRSHRCGSAPAALDPKGRTECR